MGTWANDPAGGQVWQPSQFQTIPARMVNNADGDIVWIPAEQYTLDPQGPYPGGGTKYDHPAGALAAYTAPTGEFWMRLNDGYWYRHTAPGTDSNGQPDNGVWDLSRRWNDADAARLGYAPSVRINDPTDHNGGIDLAMVAGFLAVAAAGGAFSGMLAPGPDAAIESVTTAADATASQGVSTMGETGLEWYSVDPGPDPFATTADVNAGWSYDGGYPGVDWYNSAGVGEAAASTSLDGILGTINKVSTTVNSAIRTLSGTAAQVKNNLATPAPNYTRAAGGINVGLLAVAALAWKLL